MTYKGGILTGVICTLAVVGSAGAGWWLWTHPAAPAAKPAAAPIPATVVKTLKEEQINLITLKPEAVERLALTVAPVEKKSMHRQRVYGGEVTIPAGGVLVVSAPVTGILQAPAAGMPVPGTRVTKGQTLFTLLPRVSPESRTSMVAALATSRVEAEGQIAAAQTQLRTAQVALDRAKKLLASEAGSQRAVDEAQAQVDAANTAAAAATARRDQLDKVAAQLERGIAEPIDIQSPGDGLLRNLTASPNQNVPGGAVLFEVADLSRLWVRVPVYVGDMAAIDTGTPATVGELTPSAGAARGVAAKPASAPPSANAAAGTVDLYYELDNRSGAYRPGQKVGATLQLKGEAENLTLPWPAVIYDIYGGTWVYEQTAANSFVRRRITVRFVADGTAVLAAGPAEGTKVVTAGAAELFGTETGFSK